MKNLILVVLLFTAGLANAQTSSTSEKTFKITPSYGITTLVTDFENFNSKINAGVSLEKMLASRFSVGVLFNYTKFRFNDSNYYNGYGYNNYGYNYGYNNNFYNSYGQSTQSEIFSFGINSKFFILDQGTFRPFIGGGLTYNRNNLSYDYNNSYYNYNGYYGQDSFGLNSFSGILMAGTELRFGNFGINFDFKYIKTLGNNSDYYYTTYSELENLGRAMETYDLMSFNIGLLLAI